MVYFRREESTTFRSVLQTCLRIGESLGYKYNETNVPQSILKDPGILESSKFDKLTPQAV
jgi:hypothetical protein